MRRAPRAVCAALVLLAGCDVDFVAIEEPAPPPTAILVQVSATHADQLTAETTVRIRGAASGSVAVQDEAAGRIELGDGDWLFRDSTVVDSLSPRLTVDLAADDYAVALDFPLLVRTGPASWNAEGDLTLPVAWNENGEFQFRSWSVRLFSPDRILLELHSVGPLPNPLVLPGGLVGDSASVAQLGVSGRFDRGEPEPTLVVSVSSRTEIPIPPRDG